MIDDEKKSNLADVRLKFEKAETEKSSIEDSGWHAVSQSFDFDIGRNNFMTSIDFVGKNLENGKFAQENLQNANFSVANLSGVDFSGANLTNADLSGADLSGAVLSGSVLHGTNFTGAKLNGVKFTEADLDNAILLDIEIDALGIEELQELIEYIAKYYPHKLNLTKINLTLLNLQKIDLSQINLKGVDFTGCDFTGVNIMELDLSECIITPEQIAQALGRVPSKDELAKILAPKKKKTQKFNGVDISSIFLGDGKEFGVWDVINDKGIKIETIMELGKKVFKHAAKKPEVKDEEVLKNVKSEKELITKTHNDELRKVIEERKRKELESRIAKKKEFEQEMSKDNKQKPKTAKKEVIINRGRDSR